jgi:hypothetical protein
MRLARHAVTLMDRQSFEELFRSSLLRAIEQEAPNLARHPPRIRIELYGGGHGGKAMDVGEAAAAIYLGPDCVYRIIDIGLLEADADGVRMLVRPSDHTPGPWDRTWDPSGGGPFKLLGWMTRAESRH